MTDAGGVHATHLSEQGTEDWIMGFFSELKSDLSDAAVEAQEQDLAAAEAAMELDAGLGDGLSAEESVGEVHFETPADTDPAYSFVDTINQLTADAATETDADDFEDEPAADFSVPQDTVMETAPADELPSVAPAATDNYYSNSNKGGFKMDIETGVATDETAVVCNVHVQGWC